MLIPSIDLMGGRIVQLVQGEKLKLAFDDFEYWIDRFSKYPLVQLIDLDAAMRQGENRALIEMICKRLPCQVGGGLKAAENGRRLLDIGAKRVIYGSSLFGPAGEGETRRHRIIKLEFAEDLKSALGEEALCFSVDTKAGRVAVKGWKDSVDLTPEEAVTWLHELRNAATGSTPARLERLEPQRARKRTLLPPGARPRHQPLRYRKCLRERRKRARCRPLAQD